jgi:cysteine desulfurase NifS
MTWEKTICGICPAACWVEVAIKNERIVDIRQDMDHPLGMICRRGQHAPEIIYSDDRLQYPMKRKGPKGTFDFERISWDEAYEIIVERLNKIKLESGPEAVSIYTGRGSFELSLCDMFQPKEAAVSSASNVLFPFGSPNTMGVGALCYVSFAMIAPHVTMGRMLINMFTDIENAEVLVVWGANPATDSPPMDMLRLESAAKRGAEIFLIDPRRTETVDRTGAEWIPIRPGTDGALALSMIEVIIDEDLYDIEFAEEWCLGFEELKTYVQHFSPEVVEEITGVKSDTIRKVARRIANATGSCPIMYTGLEYSDSGIQAIRAVHILFALCGQLDIAGGMGLAMNNTMVSINHSTNQPNPNIDLAVARDKFPLYSKYRAESHASGLVNSVLKSDPYKIRSLIIQGASLLTSWPQTSLWTETLKGLDFLVCIDRQLTADSKFADIVLPATTMFEVDSYVTYGPILRLREKIIEPVGEARNDYLIMAELAERLGYGHLYPQSEKDMIKHALDGSGYTVEKIKEAGGWIQIDTPMMEYKKWTKGGLRPDGKPGFDTPSGKFEIHSTILEDYGYEPLPKYVEPAEGPLGNPTLAKDFPLVFNSGARPQTDFRSQHHGIKGLNKDNPEPTVELNIIDAKSRDIKTGDLVEVKTLRGAIPFRARVTEDIISGSIECNMGGGAGVGSKAWREWNVNELTDLAHFDEISGFPVYKALLCEVTKLQEGTEDTILTALAGNKRDKTKAFFRENKKSIGRRIYLDNNATTEIDESVKDAMIPFLSEVYGNPSSIHSIGRNAREAVEKARRQVAQLLNAKPRRILFTGGGSEADNLAIKGIAFQHLEDKGHFITTKIEHPAILNTFTFLETLGFEVTYLDVDQYAMIQPDQIEKAIKINTLLVSIMMANNEVGTILPIKELSKIAHGHDVLFHTDAVQATGKIPIDIEDLNVDMASISAHKFHGPKGIGALYVRQGLKLDSLIHGGKQEAGLRGGTENVASIVGMGKAADLAKHSLKDSSDMAKLRDQLEEGIINLIPDASLNGHREKRLPNTLNMTLPKLRGESLVVALDQHGIFLSSGSACKSGSPDPTHVLIAMGKSTEEAHCSIRLSLSNSTTDEDIKRTLKSLENVLEEMKTTVRFLPCK